MEYTKDFNIVPGDRVRITVGARDPWPAGSGEGIVASAVFYDTDGWLIEWDKDTVSEGWQTGYGYWKQGQDGGTVEMIAPARVEPKYSAEIMEAVRQHIGLDSPYDTSRDAEINEMSHNSILDHVLEWEGIIGYGYRIQGWITEIYGVQLS